MKTTEMITLLQELLTIHGDREVRIWNSMENEFDSVNEIKPRRLHLCNVQPKKNVKQYFSVLILMLLVIFQIRSDIKEKYQ